MAAERFEHLPYHGKCLVIVQRLLRRHARGDHDREDDIAVFLALKSPHDPANRLDDIDL